MLRIVFCLSCTLDHECFCFEMTFPIETLNNTIDQLFISNSVVPNESYI